MGPGRRTTPGRCYGDGSESDADLSTALSGLHPSRTGRSAEEVKRLKIPGLAFLDLYDTMHLFFSPDYFSSFAGYSQKRGHENITHHELTTSRVLYTMLPGQYGSSSGI